MRTAASAPSNRQESWRHAWLVWAIFLAVVVLIVSRPWQTSTVPAASTLGESDFSAERAWTHVDMLATTIGRRVTGTETSARAADYIEGRLRRLGVETVRHVASGSIELEATYVYRGVQNVLARVPGKGAAAILVSAHYDSGAEGPGAGDNALNVAAALEIVRATLASEVPTNTIIFNFNDGEELGLLGAAAFVGHPWFKEVAAFVNLDASGPGGRQLLLQVTPGRDDLLEAYAASARHVHGTVLAQEIFQILPFDTDYHVYRDAGVGGVDLAPYGDGYAYHTPLDRTERLSRRTLQESGENVLAFLRGLDPLSPPRRHEVALPATYYDLLGLVMVRYAAGTALMIGLLVGALALILVCCLPAKAGSHIQLPTPNLMLAPTPKHLGVGASHPVGSWELRAWLPPSGGRSGQIAMIALGAVAVGFSAFLAILVPILGGVLVTLGGHTMSWYARPWIALCVYGTLAAAGVLAGQAVLRWLARRRALPPDVTAHAWQRGLVVFWALLLLVATALRLGSAYLPLWWCAGATLALVASTHFNGARRWIVTLAGVTLAAITTMQAADLLLTSMVPLTGMLGADAPAELLIAAVAALAVAPFALLVAPAIQPAPSLRHVAAYSVGAVAVIGALVVSSFPYTPERPKRAYLDVRASGEGGAHVVVEAIDPGPDLAIEDVALDAAITRPMPTIEVLPAALAESPAPRTVEIRLTAPGAYMVDVGLEGGAISWPGGGRVGGGRHLVWVGTHDPLTFHVASASGAPANVHAKAYYLGSDVSVDHVLAQLPRWSAATVQTVLEISAGF